jgi:hypothetical protein
VKSKGDKDMARELIHELDKSSKPNSRSKNPAALTAKKEGKALPTIICSCGAEILVIPDLEAMSEALKNHIEDHRKANPKAKEADLYAVEQALIEKLLKLASELGK